MIQKIFRYRASSICFALSVFIMFVALINGLGLINEAKKKDEDRIWAQYDNRIEIEIKNQDIKEEILMTMVELADKGNLILNCNGIVRIGGGNGYSNCDIMLATNEKHRYILSDGFLPGQGNESYERQVAVGMNRIKNAKEIDGKKYIMINGEDYLIVGVIGNSEDDYWSTKIVLDYEYMGNALKEDIYRSVASKVCLVSENYGKNELKELYNKLYSNVIEKYSDYRINIEAKIINDKGEDTFAKSIANSDIDINATVCIFCICNCTIISELWFVSRKRELAIRKAFGWSSMQILRLLITDILKIVLIAGGVYIAILFLGKVLFMSNILMTINWITFVGVLIGIIVVTIASVVLPFMRITRMSAAQGVKE